MKTSKITTNFQSDIETVWKVVTNNEEFTWRSDLSSIEIQDKTHFVEYTKQGFPTFFTITKKEPHKIYCFKLENKNMKGKWQGKFFVSDNGSTCVEFIEEIVFKNPILSFVGMFMNIRKIQETYIYDLKNKLATLNK